MTYPISVVQILMSAMFLLTVSLILFVYSLFTVLAQKSRTLDTYTKVVSSFSFASWALLVIVVFQGVYPFDCDTTVRIANFLESMGMMGIDYLLLYRAILLSFKNKYVMWFSYFTVAVRGIVGVMNLVFPGAKMMDGVCMYGWDVDVLTTFVVIDMLVDIIVTTVTIQSLRQYLNDAKQYLSNVGAPIQVAVIKSSVIRSFMILIVNIVMILAIFHRLLSQHGLTVCLSTCAIYQLLIITERGLVETLRKRSFQLSSHAGPSQVKARIGATATLT